MNVALYGVFIAKAVPESKIRSLRDQGWHQETPSNTTVVVSKRSVQ